MSFKILTAGIFTTLQDQGRKGFNHLGVTHSGALDEHAYLWGQKLLNNQDANALEVMVGLKLEATSSSHIAVTGADLSFKINGIAQPIWQTHRIKKGDILSFEKRVSGQRAYLAVKGGFVGKRVLGSYATTLKEQIGQKLKRGETLPFYPHSSNHLYRLKERYRPNYDEPLTLRLLLGYQDNYFTAEQKEKFFKSSYEVTLQSDRMGFKLKGEAMVPKEGGIISEGIAFGSVQIPKDGQPIVLLKERQTIGGYPKLGTVLPIDCFKLTQASIYSMVRFKVITIEKAQRVMQYFTYQFETKRECKKI